MKSIKISEKNHKKLLKMKLDKNLKTVDDVITELIEVKESEN